MNSIYLMKKNSKTCNILKYFKKCKLTVFYLNIKKFNFPVMAKLNFQSLIILTCWFGALKPFIINIESSCALNSSCVYMGIFVAIANNTLYG